MKAIPFMNLVKQYALSKGLRFFTWVDQRQAIVMYEGYASKNN